jgi:RNA polymerase sigma factor (sigma-70 family)
MSKLTSHELLKQYQAGQSEAATAIFDRYVERLIALARARIGPKLRRRVDPEDIVQSAYRSFFVHAKNQEYLLLRSGDLWRLLASTTLNKLYGQTEKHTAAKRTIDQESPDDVDLVDLQSPDPSVVEVVAIGEQLKLILDDLPLDQRLVLTSTLQGQSIEEISGSIGKSERTVRRLLNRARQQFEQRLLEKKAPSNFKTASTRSPVIQPDAPLKFCDYLLEQLLGSGGMGKVYRATDKRSGKKVAVKALHKSWQSDRRAVAQFVQEANILAQLRHANIVGVRGLGRFPSGGYFIVMDYVDGLDLQSRLDQGPLPLGEVVAIVKKVTSAVQHAHEHGIVHCDLKPGNVLVNNNNDVIVTDFGFAFVVAGAASMSAIGIGGTAGYIAPEILKGQSCPTPAADIYAIGVLLWTLATGTLPDAGSLRTEDSTLAPLKSICSQCMANDPKQRYRDAATLVTALNTLGAK